MRVIRPVTPKDAATLAALHAESFGTAAWSLKQMRGTLALDTTQGWMASEDDEAAGFILCQIMPEQAEILTFCVKPDYRRQKIGEELLQYARNFARQKGCISLFLEVAADNIPAHALYEKLGFRPIGKRRNYYRRNDSLIDALTFELPLFASKA